MNNNVIIIFLFIFFIFHIGCNQQSEALNYGETIITEEVDGNSRDLLIIGDTTLCVVSEDDGLLVYDITNDGDMVNLDLEYSDSTNFDHLNLSSIEFSNTLNKLIVLDKFYSLQQADISVLVGETDFSPFGGFFDNQHPSRFIINENEENVEIFSLIRNKSSQEGIISDIVTIYKINMFFIDGEFIEDGPFPVVDSLIYDTTDLFLINNNLFIAHTSNTRYEVSIYNQENINNSFWLLDTAIVTPLKPLSLYAYDNLLFVGMDEHGGVKIYNISTMEEILWLAAGFSVRDIYWDTNEDMLILSCGYQGLVIYEFTEDFILEDYLVLTTSYAYTARYYNNHILASTRNGIEIIKIH